MSAPAAPATSAVSVHDAARAFGDRGLAGVDLEVAAGRVVALLGPNGAGKSTLLRAAAGRLRLDRGSVATPAGDPRLRAAARRAIGFVPQDPALFGALTVRENVEVFAALAGLDPRQVAGAATRAIARVGLQAEAGRRAGVLSGGQKKRASLAAGLAHEPRLALLDEPTAGVDPAAQRYVHALVRELRDEGVAVVFSTHDVEEAEQLADEVAILAAGRLRASGPPADLTRRTFGEQSELVLTLAEEPPPAAAPALAAVGLASTAEPRRFVASATGTPGAAELVRQVETLGLRVVETRLREPGLRGVMLRLTGRDAGE
jgi:ABC-2 type transport system ATP-binding protein